MENLERDQSPPSPFKPSERAITMQPVKKSGQ